MPEGRAWNYPVNAGGKAAGRRPPNTKTRRSTSQWEKWNAVSRKAIISRSEGAKQPRSGWVSYIMVRRLCSIPQIMGVIQQFEDLEDRNIMIVILVFQNCPYKLPRTGWIKQQKYIVLPFRKLESRDLGVGRVGSF